MAHTVYLFQVHLHVSTDHNLNIDTPMDPPHNTVTKTGTNAVDPDHNHIIENTAAKITINPTEAILGHSKGTADDITGVIHNAHTQMLISTILTAILHIKSHLHT